MCTMNGNVIILNSYFCDSDDDDDNDDNNGTNYYISIEMW